MPSTTYGVAHGLADSDSLQHGVLHLTDKTWIPADPANADFAAFAKGRGDSNPEHLTLDPVSVSLDDLKQSARVEVDSDAHARISIAASASSPGAVFASLETLAEAKAADADGDPGASAASYPLLGALIPLKGFSVSEVAANVLIEWGDAQSEVAAVAAARSIAHASIDTAVTESEIETAKTAYYQSF